jgi:hypothetical protein
MRKPIHLLLLVVAPLAANAVEGQSRTPLDETHAAIVNSGSTNVQGFSLILAQDGQAELEQGNSTFHRSLPPNVTARLFAALRAAGALDALPPSRCMKSASFGTTTRNLLPWKDLARRLLSEPKPAAATPRDRRDVAPRCGEHQDDPATRAGAMTACLAAWPSGAFAADLRGRPLARLSRARRHCLIASDPRQR